MEQKANVIQAVGYLGVATATIVYYEYILTFKNEGEFQSTFLLYYAYQWHTFSNGGHVL